MPETKFDPVLENGPVMWRKINWLGIILDCNQTYADRLGYSKKEIIGKSVYEHIAQESWEDLKKSVAEWAETGKVSNIKLVFKKKDGTTFPALLNANNIYDEYGNLSGSNTVIIDLSDSQ